MIEIKIVLVGKAKQMQITVPIVILKSAVWTKKKEFFFEYGSYPYLNLVEFKNDKYPHHSIVFKNLTSLKENGLTEWLKFQKIRRLCSNCTTRLRHMITV
jgi:hypothetical protein